MPRQEGSNSDEHRNGSWENVCVQRAINREEVEKAIAKLKSGKAAGVNAMTPEIMMFGGAEITEWMLFICDCMWRRKGAT